MLILVLLYFQVIPCLKGWRVQYIYNEKIYVTDHI